jgi:glycosyltransferase involved in cell wall biosynthesis
MSSLVSIAIPCFNQACYLREAVESVVAQTYQNWELTVVDDGSPDETSEVALQIIRKHPDRKIRLIRRDNAGLATSRNVAFQQSQGDFFLPLDADDKLSPQFIETLITSLAENPHCSRAYCDIHYFGSVNYLHQVSDFDYSKLLYRNHINYCSLFRRSLFENRQYNPNMRWGYEDWDFWVAQCTNGAIAIRTAKHLFEYRKKASSMLTQAQEHDTELKARIVKNNPQAYEGYTTSWAKRVSRDPKYAQKFCIEGRHFEWLVRLSATIPRPIYIWGAGGAGQEALHYLSELGIDVVGFIDSKKAENIEPFNCYPIKGPSDALADNPFVVVASMYYNEICHHLHMLNLVAEKDYLIFGHLPAWK